MKKIAGPIRVELAQYRELAAFAQFGSDLDKDTRDRLTQGERIIEVLKQGQYKPFSVGEQIVVLYAATRKFLMDIALTDIAKFETGLIQFIDDKYPEILTEIVGKDGLTDDLDQKLSDAINEYKNDFVKKSEEV